MTRRPDVAVVDVDGTLVDTNYHHALAWSRAFGRHDVAIPVWRLHRTKSHTESPITSACSPATKAGYPGYAVRTGGFAEAELLDAGAREVFDSLTHVHDALDRLLT